MSHPSDSSSVPDSSADDAEEWSDVDVGEEETVPRGQAATTVEAELAQWKDTALRARADLDNFRKRMAQESADARRYANASLLEELLPVLDNFQFGLQAAEADAGAKNLLIGLNMVAGQLQNFLREQGVEEVLAVGKPFDPNVHEAVGQESNDQVISQVRRGYKLRDRLLRPATVIVSTGPASTR
jgi:molecular chaperone GrpE